MGIVSNLNFGQSLTNITNAINTYVVAPIADFGLSGFIFSAVGEANANLSADITDHYAEDNTAIQDQIAIRPKRITLKGYVGELTYNGPGGGSAPVNTLAEKLVSITSFLPSITAAASQVQAGINNPAGISFTGALGTASNIYALVKNTLGSFGPTQNQQNAYNYFKALMQSATLCGIQTPWEFMTNMAIENIVSIQGENSMWITDFAITYKEIRIASTSTTAPISNASASNGILGSTGNIGTPAVLSGAAAIQQAPLTNIGNLSGTPVANALIKTLF